MSAITRVVCCAGIIFLLAAGAQGAALTLSGVSIYGAGDTTGAMESGGWNTACGGISHLFLNVSTCPMAPIDISTPGQYIYTYHTATYLTDSYADLELFFGGETYTPGIHLFIARNDPNQPPAMVVPTLYQYCLGYYCNPEPDGSGSLTYVSGSLKVTANEFTEVDLNNVWTGTIQLSVADTGVPEPASLALVGLALLAAPIVLRRRARR